MSLEDLFDIEMTSVLPKEEKLSESSAAVYMVTQEDIRRTGATSIPEALRIVAGLHVAQIDTNKYHAAKRETPNTKHKLLKALYDLKFAALCNLAFENAGTTKDVCFVGTGRHIRLLEKAGLILPVRQYGFLRNEKYRNIIG